VRVAFVSPRYGVEVNGGAERLCREIAEHMAAVWDVEVLTTCALDYTTWRDEYPPGEQKVNGVPVRRFPVDAPRDVAAFNRLSEAVYAGARDPDREAAWMRAQGPYSSRLLAHLESQVSAYDRVIYVPYLYATTYYGLPLTRDRSVLVPAAHDEPPLALGIFDGMFRLPRALVFSTPEEQALVNARFRTAATPQTVAGVGLALPRAVDPERFRRAHADRLQGAPFILYAGRIDPSKGCDHLFDYFQRFRRDEPESALKLVLLGRPAMPVPDAPDIVSLGFVDDREKLDAMAAAQLLVVPSPWESLSIVALEAWQVGRPVLVNGMSDVLRGQCVRSNGGLWYDSYGDFREALAMFLARPEMARALGLAGRAWVAAQYDWRVIEEKYRALLDRVRPAA
jgi:glycosyltransferase involved in cell wall biosynthesis